MTKIDRYILAQLIGPFLFFCFIISGILLLNQALGIISIVTENGQPASIVSELVFLLLPKVLITAIPISGFTAAILLTNRLFNESELLVMMSIGRSFTYLAKPFFIFGSICFTLLFIIVHYLGPMAHSKFLDTQDKIKQEYLTQIIIPNKFISSQNKYIFFFGEKGSNGKLKDILIQEQVSPDITITYIAKSGQVVMNDGKTTLLLKIGSTQSYNTITKAFNLLSFSSLAFDLTQLEKGITTRKNSISEQNSLKLKQKITNLSDDDPMLGRAVSLYYDRHAKTLLALLFPTLGMISLLIGGYNRSGYTSRIVISILIMAGFDLFRGATKSWTADAPNLWLLQYSSPFLCSFLIILMLWYTSKDTTRIFQKANKVHS